MVELRDLEIGDAGWLVMQHGALYAREAGFDHTFEALVAEILAEFIRKHDPSCERGWIAWEGDQRLGSIFCVKQAEDVAKLRLFLLVPEARGRGVGRQLLEACMRFARECGYVRLELWTHAEHQAACALYVRTGFTLLSSREVTSFGVALTEQMWGVDL